MNFFTILASCRVFGVTLKQEMFNWLLKGNFLVTFPLKHSFTRFATSTSMFSVGCDLCINQSTKYYSYLKAPKIFFFDKVLNPNLNFPTDVVYIKKTFRNAMKHAYKETALIVCMFLVLSRNIVTRTAST